MSINPASNNVKITAITLIIAFGCVSSAFAQNTSTKSSKKATVKKSDSKRAAEEEQNLSELQKTARQYRAQGLAFQNAGDLDSAMGFYQKAIEYDPLYAVVYNDLGVVLEAKGFTDRAEECYKRSIQTDPNYFSAYSNLALLYEGQRDLETAAFYWEKRAKLGMPDDPWTKKARARLNDIRLVLSDKPFEEAQEQEVVDLMRNVSSRKAAVRKDNKTLAKSYFNKAKLYYKKGDEVTALKLAIDASQLDPSNEKIEEFVNKIQSRVLSK